MQIAPGPVFATDLFHVEQGRRDYLVCRVFHVEHSGPVGNKKSCGAALEGYVPRETIGTGMQREGRKQDWPVVHRSRAVAKAMFQPELWTDKVLAQRQTSLQDASGFLRSGMFHVEQYDEGQPYEG